MNLIDYGILEQCADDFRDGLLVYRKRFALNLCTEDVRTMPLVIRCEARITGAEPPTLEYELTRGDASIYRSIVYTVCSSGSFERHEWRVPPPVGGANRLMLRFVVPEGTTLFIRALDVCPSDARVPWAGGGMRLNAHLGFWGLCPDNTMSAFELAHECGYPACIVVPKATRDGNLVCIHDDTINRTARDAAGNPPSEPMYVRDMTLDELRKWEYGSYKQEIWRGTQIPTLEEFFALCARTGMRPMFSTHPDLTDAQWEMVRELLAKYGLTKLFHIKSFGASCLAHAWSFFGDTIEGYTYDVNVKTLDIPANLAALDATGIDRSRCRVGVEIPQSEMTPERAAAIRAAGCFASVWNVFRITGARYHELAAMGVTEVTDDYNCSYGLNW